MSGVPNTVPHNPLAADTQKRLICALLATPGNR
jgi:hypothetical protein